LVTQLLVLAFYALAFELGALGILGTGEVGGFFGSRPPFFTRLIAIGETLVEFLDCLSMFVLDPFDLRPGSAGL
jgi:hypothetical protein